MKRDIYLFAALLSALAVIGLSGSMSKAIADSEMRVSIDRGTYPENYRVSITSIAGTEFLAAGGNRMDGVCFNNSASTIWIGTTTATQHLKEHANITLGIPWLASSTFRLDGVNSSAWAATTDIGVASADVRCLGTLNR